MFPHVCIRWYIACALRPGSFIPVIRNNGNEIMDATPYRGRGWKRCAKSFDSKTQNTFNFIISVFYLNRKPAQGCRVDSSHDETLRTFSQSPVSQLRIPYCNVNITKRVCCLYCFENCSTVLRRIILIIDHPILITVKCGC